MITADSLTLPQQPGNQSTAQNRTTWASVTRLHYWSYGDSLNAYRIEPGSVVFGQCIFWPKSECDGFQGPLSESSN